MRIDVNNKPVFVASRSATGCYVANVHRGFGITIHRDGGFSIVGAPREGGTTIAWGRKLRARMLLGTNYRHRRFGPLHVYSGEDF